ncbi:hypothetical protein FACS1894193_08000 [Bacilli bacterium]|nr:hypothetical protein FACS1894192_09740 [Bacilli bacterium]GHU42513.1 hypothetical protein FACS1894193_08000 [Bacilli bacterium]
MKIKTGVAIVLSAATLGVEAHEMTTDVVADTQEEKSPTFSPSSATSRTVSVSGADFLNYFQRNGSAARYDYDLSNQVQILTPNQRHQSGNVTLKTKVDMSQDFTFTGLINLGDKSSRRGGADGVGFLFHPGDTDVVGRDGGAAGIGGVQGAFGFKLDTYYNSNSETSFNPDPDEFSRGQSYGAFVDGTSGVAQTIEESAQAIAQPSYNQFKPFKMSYNGTVKVMTITYDGQTWQQNVSNLIGDNQSMSFSISASTGDNYNLQQLQISNFQYTIAQGTVTANYIDEDGNQLKTPVITHGDIDTIYATNQANIPGYTFKAVTGVTPAGTYQANTQTVNYIYTRNQGLLTVRYIDDTTGQVLKQNKFSGATGEKAAYATADEITTYQNSGYKLVLDQYPATGVTFTDQAQSYDVHLTHQKVTTKENNVVHQTIHYQYKNGQQAANDYSATPLAFTRTVTTDQTTGDKTYGNWTADNGATFAKVTSPSFKGFTPDHSQIDAIDKVMGETPDIEKTVVYTPNQEAATVTYIDNTRQKTLATQDLSGDFGTTDPYRTAETIKNYLAKGYDLVTDDYPKAGVVYDEDGVVKHYTVHLFHKTLVNHDSKIVNETVHYQFKNGQKAAADYTATPIHFTRPVITDQVTGAHINGSWTAVGDDNFAAVVSPSLKGVTPDRPQIDVISNVSGDTANIVKTVVYSPNQEKARVSYIDDTNHQLLATKDLSGDFGTTDDYRTAETIKQYKAEGYDLVSDQYPTTGVVYDQDGITKHYEVHLTHRSVASSDTKAVNETVHYQFENGKKAAADFTATPIPFKRTVVTDRVRSYRTYGEWTAVSGTSFEKVISPTLTGYTPDYSQIDAIDQVTGETKDIVKTVVYKPNQEAASVTYIDDTRHQSLETKHLVGKFSATDAYRTADTIKAYQAKGYDLVSDQYPATGVVYDQDGVVKHYDVHLTHQMVAKKGAKVVNETVHYQYKNGDKVAEDYTATPLPFTRTETVDQVTGDKTYGDWTSVTDTIFASVASPELKGYTADQPEISAIDQITGETEDIVKTVVYQAKQESAKVAYIDDTADKTLAGQELSGAFGTTDSYQTADTIKQFKAQGYDLVSDAYPETGVVYDEDGIVKHYEVHLAHKNKAKTEYKNVNETIHYQFKNGGKAAKDATAMPLRFMRVVTTDQVMGVKTYGDWTAVNATSFKKVTSPELKGYTADQAEIAAIDKITGETKDIVKTVVYTAVEKPKAKPITSQPSQPAQTPAVSTVKKELPDTGAKSGVAEAILGAIVFISTFGMMILRKKRQ